MSFSYSLSKKKVFKQRCKHFSFIFDGSKLISFGCNSLKTHPQNLKFSYIKGNKDISSIVGTHSELKAVLKTSCGHFSGLTMVNTRINRNGDLDYSAPCAGCMDMISTLGFKNVYFTVKGGDFHRIKI